jgi:hypothetical protein
VLDFAGTALALLTHQGPDSGRVRCEVTRLDGGAESPTSIHRACLFDQWSYYYRLSVALLVEGLPAGRYRARITLESAPPERACAKRALQPTVAGPLRLWLSHYLVLSAGAFTSRALTAGCEPAGAEADRVVHAAPVATQRAAPEA